MKLQIKNNRWVEKNWSLEISEDLKKIEAWSYRWWRFIATDTVGNIIFNATAYSPSTGQHQSAARGILNKLGIKVDLTLYSTKSPLRSLKDALKEEIDEKQAERKSLIEATKKRGTHKAKNESRLYKAQEIAYEVKDLERFLKENLNKKKLTHQDALPKISDYINEKNWGCKACHKMPRWTDRCGAVHPIDVREARRLIAIKRYYKKPNGKIDVNGFRACLGKIGRRLHEAPRSIEKLKGLLGLKGNASLEFALVYPHTKDVETMIPGIESPEYSQLERWLKTYCKSHPINTFLLEKIHCYLTNKINRKNYTPKEPLQLPVAPKLLTLERTVDNLKVIKTDRELKAEGRSQSHCIGSSSYIKQCIRGYQALNYKGYTFFLTPQLDIDQTYGKFNRETPMDVQYELKKLLRA